MNKKYCNTLIITKKHSEISNNSCKYIFEWKNKDITVLKEILLVDIDIKNDPINFNLNELIEHKKYCCLDIQSLDVQEIVS